MCAKVLVVDDDPVNADLLGYLLQAFGHEPIRALDGEAALQEAFANVPDLVLCDIQMPGMDGYEVLRRLRADERLVQTPVVGVTALAMVGDREKILGAGFDGYLTKPITPETFVSEIEKYLSAEHACARAPEPTPPTANTPSARRRRLNGYALVVDDLQANIDLVVHLLDSIGLSARGAHNLEAALVEARAARPVLIISDVHMAGGDGLQLLEAVKSDQSLKDVPFVLTSSTDPSLDEERQAVSGGVDAWMVRPLDPETMLSQLSRWIPTEPAS